MTSLLALAYAVLWLAPASTEKALRWNCAEPSLVQLENDLTSFSESTPGSGGVQCMDTTAGCITALSRLHLVQSTGFLYDCYFFAPQPSAAREAERQFFLETVTKAPPALYVITDQWCFNLPTGYRKLDEWPAFEDLLASHYTLALERPSPEIPRKELAAGPFGYRVYRLNGQRL